MEESGRAKVITLPSLSAMIRNAEEETRICRYPSCTNTPHRPDFSVPDVFTRDDHIKQMRKYDMTEKDHWVIVDTGPMGLIIRAEDATQGFLYMAKLLFPKRKGLNQHVRITFDATTETTI